MNRISCFVVIGALWVLACSPLQIDTEYDRHHDFSTFRTFDILPEDDESAENLPPGWRGLRDSIETSVVANMESAGFQKADGENPDFLVAIRITGPHSIYIGNRAVFDSAAVYYDRYDNPWPTRHYFKEGTLVIDILDPDDQRLLWRGWATRVVDDADVTEKRFQEAVSRLLDKFPPR